MGHKLAHSIWFYSWRILTVLVFIGVAFVWPIKDVSAAISDPATFTLDSVEVYNNAAADGDMLFLARYNMSAPAGTSLTIDDTFLGRLLDGTTEKGAVQPYGYHASGYAPGIFALYFSPSDVTSLGLTWGGAYTVRIEGNPAQPWSSVPPPSRSTASLSWISSATTAEASGRLAIRIRFLASYFETQWTAVDLIEDLNGVKVLTSDGQAYFGTAIPGLNVMVPQLFPATTVLVNFPDKPVVKDNYMYSDDTEYHVYGLNWYAQTFRPSADYLASGFAAKVLKVGAPTAITWALRATAAGVPTGPNLRSGTVATSTDFSTFSKGEWEEFVFSSDIQVYDNTTYALVMYATGSAVNYIGWRYDSAGAYGTYSACTSADNGTTWAAAAANDMMFAVLVRDAHSGTGQSGLLRYQLNGTALDLNPAATAWKVDVEVLGSVIWLAISIFIAFLVTRFAQSYKPALFIIAWMMPAGWYIYYVNVFAAFIFAILLTIAGVFAVAWRPAQ